MTELRTAPPLRRILLVDDDALILRSLARVLQGEFDVVTAVDAADAIAKTADDLYSAITDHDLRPGLDGLFILAEARRRVPTALRILMSGRPQSPLVGDADWWHTFR